MLMVGKNSLRPLNSMALEDSPGYTRILASQGIHFTQEPDGPEGQVLKIPYRRSDEEKSWLWFTHGNVLFLLLFLL